MPENDDTEFVDAENVLVVVGHQPERPPVKSPGFFRHFWLLATGVLLHPVTFFDAMPAKGGYRDPLVFAAISVFCYSMLLSIGNQSVWYLFLAFAGGMFQLLIATLLSHFILTRLGGKGTLEGTFRVMAYSKATLLFAWISLAKLPIGGISSLIYACYIGIRGMAKVHALDVKKVTLVIGAVTLLSFMRKLWFF